MGRILQFTLRHAPVGVLADVKRFRARPVETQAKVLRSLLSRASKTEWGRRYAFDEILREPDVIAAFQERVPLHTYEDFRPDIVRIMAGEADICWPGRFRYTATSAGTTSRGKSLPVTTTALRNELKFARLLGMTYIAETGRTGWLRGRVLALSGHVTERSEYPGMLVGAMTGCITHYQTSTGRFARALSKSLILPERIRKLADFSAKATAIADEMMDKDVRTLVMMPSWGLNLIDRIIDRYNERNRASVKTLAEIWPNLQLYISGGLPLRSYRDAIEKRLGKSDVDFVENYGAAEGAIAFQTSRDDPAMLLHLDNEIFFEFVRMDEMGQKNPRRHAIGDVETDVPYSLVLSNCNGLWAYHLNDVVRFTQLSPHKLLVLGRGNEVLDTYGEYILGEEARSAVLHAARHTNSHVREFHLAPRPADETRAHTHQWIVEFVAAPKELDDFANALDARLREINSSYDSARATGGFAPPEVVPVPPGTFAEWLQQERKEELGETKVPIMRETRDIADWLVSAVRPESRPSDTIKLPP